MKKKAVGMLLGGVLMAAAAGGSAQAMTYSWDDGSGHITLYSAVEDGDLQDDTKLSEEEKAKLSSWHRAEMKDELAYLEKYGVIYDAENDVIYYQGKTVRWLIDEQIADTYKAVKMPEGEIDLYTERSENYHLTGVRVATEEEYAERTKQDQEAVLLEESREIQSMYVFTADEDAAQSSTSGKEDGSWEYTLGDGSVLYTYVEEANMAADVLEDAQNTYATEESTIAYEADGFSDSPYFQEKQKEYEAAGIAYDSERGAWLWGGKMIYWLMDEDGGMYQNGAEEAKENKIYILVKRNTDGTIKEAKRMTIEDMMLEKMKQDE